MFTYTAFGHDFISVNNNLFMRGSEIGALHRTDANASLLKVNLILEIIPRNLLMRVFE